VEERGEGGGEVRTGVFFLGPPQATTAARRRVATASGEEGFEFDHGK